MNKTQINKLFQNNFKNNVEIIIDTREQNYFHIENFFVRNKINFREEKLNTGDYSFIYNNKNYSDIFSVDRKRNIDELIGNFCEKRFYEELNRAKLFKYFSFVIEEGYLNWIYSGNYRSKMLKKSAIAIVESWQARGIRFEFIDGINFGKFFIWKIYYFLRNEMIEG